MISPDGRTSAGTWRNGLTASTRLRAASSSQVTASTTSYGMPSSVSVASIGTDPEAAAPNILSKGAS